jgi:hypothetical protein
MGKSKKSATKQAKVAAADKLQPPPAQAVSRPVDIPAQPASIPTLLREPAHADQDASSYPERGTQGDVDGTNQGDQDPSLSLSLDSDPGLNSYPNHPYPPTSITSLHQPGFLDPPTAPASSAHGLGLGPTLVVLDDPSNKYLQAQQTFYATHPPSHTSVTSSIPNVPPPLPVSLPRLPCIPPLVVHQEQLYFDDGLGAPGRCPHERNWGEIGKEHKEERGLGLSDVEMDDFMVDLGDLVSKEYDAWIERCW